MITKEQALTAVNFHFGDCKRIIGPRGGETVKVIRVRRTGKTRTWKTRPDEFHVPIKFGLYQSGYITHSNAADFHTEANCTLNLFDDIDMMDRRAEQGR